MVFFCGLGGVCVKPFPAFEELTQQEVTELFSLSTRLNNGRLIVHGLFARADATTTNGRIYPKAVLKREVRRFRRQHVQQGTALGELNHPSYYSSYFRSLNLPNISHQVLDVYWRGRELWGIMEVLPTPAGLLLWELYSKGIKLGVSSRGWASVVLNPATQQLIVDKDLQLITFDFVTEPSNAGAFLVPIDYEYRKPLPDQSHVVRVSYLGIGSSPMSQLKQMPGATALSSWLKQTRTAVAAAQRLTVTGNQQQQQLAPSRLPPGVSSNTLLRQPSVAVAVACSAHPHADESCGAGHNCQSDGIPCSGDSVVAADDSSLLTALVSRGSCVPADLSSSLCLGGGVQLGCHYRVLDDLWLPVDPAGREFKVHLSLVATKAHLLQQKQEKRRQMKQHQLPQLQQVEVQQQQEHCDGWLLPAQQCQPGEGADSEAAVTPRLVLGTLQQVPTFAVVHDQLRLGREAQLQQPEGEEPVLPSHQHDETQPQPRELLSAGRESAQAQQPSCPPAVNPTGACQAGSCNLVLVDKLAVGDGSNGCRAGMRPVAHQHHQNQNQHTTVDARHADSMNEQHSCAVAGCQQQLAVLQRRPSYRMRIAPGLSGCNQLMGSMTSDMVSATCLTAT